MPPKNREKGVQATPGDAGDKKKLRKAKMAEKKAAKLRAAEERENFLKMERLKREIEHGDRNTKRFSRTWCDMVVNVKIPQIKEDLEVAWHTFDRALDIKNYSVSLLLDEIDSAHEQYQMNERAHLETINRLMDIYKSRLVSEEKRYEAELKEMMDGTMAETETITLKQTDDEVFLQTMMFAMEQHLEVLMKVVKGATISKVGEVEDNDRNTRRVAKYLLEKELHELGDEYMANLTRYQNATEDLRREYIVVKEKDDRARHVIASQLTRTGNLFESIRKFREKIAGYKLSAEKEIAEITAEQDFFNDAYWTVKTRFMTEQTVDKDQLKTITAEYKATTKQLTRILAKGENLLSLATICRKYETVEEKVLPFRPPPALDEDPEKLGVDIGWERSHAVMDEFRNLELFWRRVGSAQIMAKQLRGERNRLREEDRCLRQCLERCLSERSMPSEPTPENEARHLRGQVA